MATIATEAHFAFAQNIQRAGYFLDVHEEAHHRKGAPPLPVRELPRGALVFAVGALDAYIADVSAEVLVAQVQRHAATRDLRDILKKVQNEVPTLAVELALMNNPTERMERLRDCIVDHFHTGTSNHGAKAVATAIQRFGGRADDLWKRLEARSWTNTAAELDRWTAVRHEIVHRGKSPTVRRGDARAFIEMVDALVDEVDTTAMAAKNAA